METFKTSLELTESIHVSVTIEVLLGLGASKPGAGPGGLVVPGPNNRIWIQFWSRSQKKKQKKNKQTEVQKSSTPGTGDG